MKFLFRFIGFASVLLSTRAIAQNKTAVFEGRSVWVYPYRFEILDHLNNSDLTYARDEEEDCLIAPYPGILKDGEYIAWYQYSLKDSAEGVKPRIAACFSIKSGKPEGRCRFFHYMRKKSTDSALLEMSGNYVNGEKEGLWQGTLYSIVGLEIGYVSINYKNGLAEGPFKATYINGEVLQGNYTNNKKNGLWTQPGKSYFFENGKRKGNQSDTVGMFIIKYELERGIDKPAEIKIYNRFNGRLEYRISEISAILNYQNYIKTFESLDPFLMNALKVFDYDFLNRNEYRIQIFNEGKNILSISVNEGFDKPEKLSYTKKIDYLDQNGKSKRTQFSILFKPLPGFGNYCKRTTADGVLLEEVYFTDHAEKESIKEIKMESDAFEYYHQKHNGFFEDNDESYLYHKFPAIYNSARKHIKYFVGYDPRYFTNKPGGFVSGSVIDSTVFVDTFPFLYRLTKLYAEKNGNFLQVIEMYDRKGNKTLKNGAEYPSNENDQKIRMRRGLYKLSEPRIEMVKYYDIINGKCNTDEKSLRDGGSFYYSEYENYLREETEDYWSLPETEIYNNETLLVGGKPYTGEIWFQDSVIIYGDSDRNKQYDLSKAKILAEKNRIRVRHIRLRSKKEMTYLDEHEADLSKKILKISYKEGKREGNFFFLREEGKDTFLLLKYGQYSKGTLVGQVLNPSGEWYQNSSEDSSFCISLLNFETSSGSDTSKQEGMQYVLKKSKSQKPIVLSEEDQQKTDLIDKIAKDNYNQLLKKKILACEIKKSKIKGPCLIQANYYWLRTTITDEGFGDTIELLYSNMNPRTRIIIDKKGNGEILNYGQNKKLYYPEQLYKIKEWKIADTSYFFYENGTVASFATGWEENDVKIKKEQDGNILKVWVMSSSLNYTERAALSFSYHNSGRYPELLYSEYYMTNLKSMIDQKPLKEVHFNKSRLKVAEGKNSGFGEMGVWNYYYPDGKKYMRTCSFGSNSLFPRDDSVYCYLPDGCLYYSALVEKEESDMDCESLITIPAILPKEIHFGVQPQKHLISGDTWVYLKQYRQNKNLYAEGWYNLSRHYKDSVWKFYSKNGVLNEIGKYHKNLKEGRWLSGNLTGINYLDNSCFDPSDSTMMKRQMNSLQFTLSVYKEGELLKESVTRVDKNEYAETPDYLLYNYWFETVDPKLSRSEMIEKGYYKPARILIYLD